MNASEDLIAEFAACHGPFPYRKLVRLLSQLGYERIKSNSGSGRKFRSTKTGLLILLHEPHPGHDLKPYMVRQIRDALRERGEL